MKPLKTATKILEHYIPSVNGVSLAWSLKDDILKVMRHYSRLKSDIAYEKGFQTALKLYNLK